MTVEQILPWVLLLSIVAFAAWWIFRPSARSRKTDFRVITASAVLVLMTGGFIFWQSGFQGPTQNQEGITGQSPAPVDPVSPGDLSTEVVEQCCAQLPAGLQNQPMMGWPLVAICWYAGDVAIGGLFFARDEFKQCMREADEWELRGRKCRRWGWSDDLAYYRCCTDWIMDECQRDCDKCYPDSDPRNLEKYISCLGDKDDPLPLPPRSPHWLPPQGPDPEYNDYPTDGCAYFNCYSRLALCLAGQADSNSTSRPAEFCRLLPGFLERRCPEYEGMTHQEILDKASRMRQGCWAIEVARALDPGFELVWDILSNPPDPGGPIYGGYTCPRHY